MILANPLKLDLSVIVNKLFLMNKLSIQFSGICILLFILTISVHGQEPGYGIAAQSVINLRQTPSFAAEMGTQALMGTPVQILETIYGWSHVITPDGYQAWTTRESVKEMSSEELKAWKEVPKAIFMNYFGVLRSQPSENAEVVSDVVMGDIVRYLGKTRKYLKVQIPDGRTAFLRKTDAMLFDRWLSSGRPTADKIIATAKLYTGFPYLWGGTSIKGMDCSGFTKNCFFMNGIILLRDASQQAQTGDNIDITSDLNNLLPADLLFFGSLQEGKEHVTHVAIYIGNGAFIHSSGTVHISSLLPGTLNYDAFNANRLLRAQRILTQLDLDSGIISVKRHPFYQK